MPVDYGIWRDVYGLPPLTYNIPLDPQSISDSIAPLTGGLVYEFPGGIKLDIMPDPTVRLRSAPAYLCPDNALWLALHRNCGSDRSYGHATTIGSARLPY